MSKNWTTLLLALFFWACDSESIPTAPPIIEPPAADTIFPIRQAADGKSFAMHKSVFTEVFESVDLVGEYGSAPWAPNGDKARRQPDPNWYTVVARHTQLVQKGSGSRA